MLHVIKSQDKAIQILISSRITFQWIDYRQRQKKTLTRKAYAKLTMNLLPLEEAALLQRLKPYHTSLGMKVL